MDSIAKVLTIATSQPTPTVSNSEPSAIDWRPTLDTSDPTVAKAARYLAGFVAAAKARKQPGKWLTLSGKTGTGKTMLAKQAFAEIQPTSLTRAFVRSRDFADEMFSGNWSIARAFERTEFLVFDDLGANRDKGGAIANALAELAEIRLGRWTLWTTNLTLDLIDDIDPRIRSRITRDGNQFVRIEADDWELRNRKLAA